MGAALSEESFAAALHQAMKAREMPRVYVLRGLLTAIRNRKIDKRTATLGEGEIAEIVGREIRKRTEAEEFARRANRAELVEQNRTERAILEAFLPPPLGREELERVVRELVASGEGGSLGKIMGQLRARYAGRFDGREASEIARVVLAEHGER